MESDVAVARLLNNYAEIADRPIALLSKDRIWWVNESLCKLVAQAASGLLGSDISRLFSAPLVLSERRSMVSANHLRHATGVEVQCEVRTLPLSGAVWAVEVTVRSFYDQSGELEVFKQRFWTLADQVPVGIFISEVGLRLQYVNDHLAEIFESSVETLVGMGWLRMFSEADRAAVEEIAIAALSGNKGSVTAQIQVPSGKRKRVHIQFAHVSSSDDAAGFVGTVEDVTDRLAHEQRLTHAATHDPLTQLPNRAALEVDLHAIVHAVREGSMQGVLVAFCDIDHFKSVNDNFGHLVGDQLLVEVSRRLQSACRGGDQAYRFAGDEFVLVFPDVVSDHDAMEIMHRLEKVMMPSVFLDYLEIKLSASFGYAIGMGAHLTLEDLLQRADAAMYERKSSREVLADRSEARYFGTAG